MTAIVKPKKISIYINDGYKTMDEIKAETGCTHIINGGTFDWDWTPNPLLKVDGKWIATANYNAWGIGFNGADDCRMDNDSSKYANYISCVDLINPVDGGNYPPRYNPDMGGSRHRTAWGILKNGCHLLYCGEVNYTPEGLRDYLASHYEFESLLMFDGGGSAQCDFDGWKITVPRKVHNFICFWADEAELEDEDNMLLKNGSEGSAVRELQEKLNKIGAGLVADGQFGAKTEKAVINFQNFYSLEVDGIVGANTKEQLERALAVFESDNALVRTAAKYIGIVEPNGDDSIIAEYNKIAGSGFGNTVAWCQMFVVVMQKLAGASAVLTASCTAARTHYQKENMWKTTVPGIGSLLYLDWDLSGDCDHVGIVAAVEGDNIYIIEGNSAGVGSDGVRFKKYAATDKRISGYADLNAPQKNSGKRWKVVFENYEDAQRFASLYSSAKVEEE